MILRLLFDVSVPLVVAAAGTYFPLRRSTQLLRAAQEEMTIAASAIELADGCVKALVLREGTYVDIPIEEMRRASSARVAFIGEVDGKLRILVKGG